jgi:hypothetical protein
LRLWSAHIHDSWREHKVEGSSYSGGQDGLRKRFTEVELAKFSQTILLPPMMRPDTLKHPWHHHHDIQVGGAQFSEPTAGRGEENVERLQRDRDLIAW